MNTFPNYACSLDNVEKSNRVNEMGNKPKTDERRPKIDDNEVQANNRLHFN